VTRPAEYLALTCADDKFGTHKANSQNGRSTTIPTTTHRLPRATAFFVAAAPSCVHSAANTFFPPRLTSVSSTATRTGAPGGTNLSTINRATHSPTRSTSHVPSEKNRQAAWNETTSCIPDPAGIPTTLSRPVCATRPVASSWNIRNPGARNAGRTEARTWDHETGNLNTGSISGHLRVQRT
jgi:hypothetical protein